MTCLWSARLSFHDQLTPHPLKQTLPCYNHVLSWKKYITLKLRHKYQPDKCMYACYCTVFLHTHKHTWERLKEKERERERERANFSFTPLYLSWHEKNNLPCRAMAGTNLLKVICSHCGWKGLSHQWAFVRHFILKLKWNAMLEISAANLFFMNTQ